LEYYEDGGRGNGRSASWNAYWLTEQLMGWSKEYPLPHFGGTNIGLVDGHVQWLSLADYWEIVPGGRYAAFDSHLFGHGTNISFRRDYRGVHQPVPGYD
ncbi:unnamed protein product, partial [marine sediment metagenome]